MTAMVKTEEKQAPQQSELWYIHGKAYDLTRNNWLSRHPGGSGQLLMCKGHDVTSLVESVHAMTKESWRKMLGKFEVPDAPPPPAAPTYDWTLANDGGPFYAELKRRVREALPQWKEPNGLMAPPSYWYWLLPYGAVDLCMFYMWLSTGSMFWALICASMNSMLGFSVMHTAGHGGISRNLWVERGLYIFWTNAFYFWHTMWDQHHNMAHHMFTGDYEFDPDLHYGKDFFRRHAEQDHVTWRDTFQHLLSPLYLTFLPGQVVGQMGYYLYAYASGVLFHLTPVRATFHWTDPLKILGISGFSMYMLAIRPLLTHGTSFLPSLAVYFTVGGFWYWFFVFGNHDTTHPVNFDLKSGKVNWAVTQIVNSGDFWLPNWFARLTGGMNFQIEHHLFPSIHHSWLPYVAPIVAEMCKEHNIRYTHWASWGEAFRKWYGVVFDLSHESYKKCEEPWTFDQEMCRGCPPPSLAAVREKGS